LNGLSKLRSLKNYNTREDLFKNLTENASSKGDDHSITLEAKVEEEAKLVEPV
jgi:hypothetical protein